MDVASNEVRLQVSNYKRELNETEKQKPKGIGIKNIKRRLELLFLDRYNLEINENNEKFDVKLIIKI